jgi:hypothetical protein
MLFGAETAALTDGKSKLRLLGVAAIVAALAGQSDGAWAFACNNNHYVNVSGHIVHSPTCDSEPGHHTAQ